MSTGQQTHGATLTDSRRLFEARDLALGGLMGALALVLPIAFHALGGAGPIFLPMFYPIMALALLASWQVALLVALMVPVLSSLLTGMPPPPVAALMACELSAMAVAASLIRARGIGPWPAALAGLLAARAVGFALVVLLLPLLGMETNGGLYAWAVGAFVVALPGTIVVLTVVPAAVYAVERAFMLGPRNGKPDR